MKKTMSVITAVTCVALSLTVFVLPGYASNTLAAASNSVMEIAPPKEYMNDFSVTEDEPGKQPNYSKYYNTVFIGEGQINDLKEVAGKAFMDEMGMEIPEDMTFDYHTTDQTSTGGSVSLYMNWEDNRATALSDDGFSIYNDGVTFRAMFDIVGQGNGVCAVLGSLGTNNGCATTVFDGFREQAVEAFLSELGLIVPDDYILNTMLNISYSEDNPQNTMVSLEWCESELIFDTDSGEFLNTRRITASFDKADLSQNTGKLTQLTDSAVYTGEPSGLPELTKGQEARLLEAAKSFFTEKGVKVGEIMERGGVTRSYQLDWNGSKAMWFVFNQVPENNSGRAYMEIIITSDLQVIGYAY